MVSLMLLQNVNFKSVATGACLLVSATVGLAAVTIPKDWPRMEPGYFEAHVKMFGQQHTNHVCLTKADLQDAEKSMAAEHDCNIVNAKQKINQYVVEMDCQTPDNAKPIHMVMTSTLFSKVHSKTNMQGTQNGHVVFQMETTLKRKRDCTQEEALQQKNIDGANVVDQLGDRLNKGSLEALKGLLKDLE